MKIKDCFRVGFQYIKGSKKRSFLNSIIFSILFLTIFISISIYISMYGFIHALLYDAYLSRSLTLYYDDTQITQEEAIEKVKNIPHVVEAYSDLGYQTYASIIQLNNESIDWGFNIYGANKQTLPKIVEGRHFEENEENAMICPTYLLINGDSSNVLSDQYMNGKKILNQIITLEINEYDYTTFPPKVIKSHKKNFKIVGLYDSRNEDIDNMCFTSFAAVENINRLNQATGSSSIVVFFVDDARNIKSVSEQIRTTAENEKIAFSLNRNFDLDTTTLETVFNSIQIFIMVCIVLFIIMLVLFIIKNIKRRKEAIGLWKTLGYSNTDIRKILTVESILLIVISYLSTVMFFHILLVIMNYIVNHFYFMLRKFKIVFPWGYSFVVLLFFFGVTYLLSLFFTKKIEKIDVVEMINRR